MLPRIARLSILLLFFSLANAAAAGDLDRARGIIGILPLPEVFGAEPCDPFKAQDIELFRTPQSPRPYGRIYVARPWSVAPDGGCQGLEVSVARAEPVPKEELLPTLEFAYEKPGAIVLRRKGQWFAIVLDEGYAWVRVQDGERFLPIEKLLEDSLTYLRPQGQFVLRKGPGRGEALWSPDPNSGNDLPVEVLDFKKISGQLWVQVRLLEREPCTEKRTNVVPVSGWLPFHDATGMPTIWFFSRGC